jgi:hypothetical protein
MSYETLQSMDTNAIRNVLIKNTDATRNANALTLLPGKYLYQLEGTVPAFLRIELMHLESSMKLL